MFHSTNLQINTTNYDFDALFLIEFIRTHLDVELVTIQDVFSIPEKTLLEVMEECRTLLPPSKLCGTDQHTLTLKNDIQPFIVIVTRNIGRILDSNPANIQIKIVAEQSLAVPFIRALEKKFHRTCGKVHWWYSTAHGPDSTCIDLKDSEVITEMHYPWMEKDPLVYFKEFLDSTCPILFLSGEPGTGKTTFLRTMLNKFGLTAYVAYDSKLFDSDAMFIEFISSNAQLIIFEDAENLVLPRKKNNNSMMARFLNVSDGLIKLPHKKFIFTTNDSDFNNIDEALIRPGRCFDSMEFRSLSFEEAQKVAAFANLPALIDKRHYTIAEIFNQRKTVAKFKVGMI